MNWRFTHHIKVILGYLSEKKEETLDFVLGGIVNLCHIDTQKPTVAVCRLCQTWADGREGQGHGGVHCIADQNLLYFPNDFCTKITQGKWELKNEYNIDWSSNFVLIKLKCDWNYLIGKHRLLDWSRLMCPSQMMFISLNVHFKLKTNFFV